MNYNPNAGIRNHQGPGRKVKRVSDVNAMGFNATPSDAGPFIPAPTAPTVLNPMMGNQNNYIPPTSQTFNNGPGMIPQQSFNYSQSNMVNAAAQPFPTNLPGQQIPAFGGIPNLNPSVPTNPNVQPFNNTVPQFAMFQQPIVQDMAMQYGQRLADQGKQLVENQFEKWVPVAKLKYYFAVDNKYVMNKLRLLFFPFAHQDWSLKYDQENPVQPRYDVNAPDLYIPTMAYITYVVVAGLLLGMQDRFTPEQLGIHASGALAYSIIEILIYLVTIYVVNIKTNLKTLDLLAFTGYKFVAINACLCASTLFFRFGYYLTLCYCSLSLGFFFAKDITNEGST